MISSQYYTGAPSVTSLTVIQSSNTSVFTLNCTSTDSPATTVIWTKDGSVLSADSGYQVLRDGSTSTYDTLLTMDSSPDELVGTYTCSVLNSAGQSNAESVTVQGRCSSLMTLHNFTLCSHDP